MKTIVISFIVAVFILAMVAGSMVSFINTKFQSIDDMSDEQLKDEWKSVNDRNLGQDYYEAVRAEMKRRKLL